MLNPLAPHITSEIYERVFNADILDEKFPEYDESKTVKDEINFPVQINGKMKGTILVSRNINQELMLEKIKTDSRFTSYDLNAPKKVIFIPGKIINIIFLNTFV